jgi:hypothetical protein
VGGRDQRSYKPAYAGLAGIVEKELSRGFFFCFIMGVNISHQEAAEKEVSFCGRNGVFWPSP